MKITKISARELDNGLSAQWQKIQNANPDLANPYFCFEYTRAVAAVKDNVYIGVMEQNNKVIGVFPWEQRRKDIIGPVGGILSDYQGAIIAPHHDWNVETLMTAYGINIWEFDHLLLTQKPQVKHPFFYIDYSPVMDLSHGYENYLKEKKSSGAKRLSQFQRKARKFQREIGGIRVDLYSKDNAAFEKVIEWKNEQCLRSGVPEFLKWGWTRAMLEYIWHTNNPNFSGMLTVLSTDKEIIAAHFGMRSKSVCHWWFPTYNHAYSKYSPGGILLLKLAEAVAREGLSTIDLGKGDDIYKPSFATGGIPLIEGSVMRPSITSAKGLLSAGLNHFRRHSSVTAPVIKVLKKIK